jgi:hypothetical protein
MSNIAVAWQDLGASEFTDQTGNEFAVQRLVADFAAGRAIAADGHRLLAELRLAGDIHRMERLARALRG